ncbi:MAG: hypothetical protein KGD73_11470 [Candidatus Lokiarchaeota archaeon]|nr:hypothetical protein [Candidatus Lokiarchaeota archaeon]
MQVQVISLLISGSLLAFFILFTLGYKNHIEKRNERLIIEEKGKHVQKYVVKESRNIMTEKLLKISKIIDETKKHVEDTVKDKIKIIEDQANSQEFETEMIEKGGKAYRLSMSGLLSAIPKTKEELVIDKENLEEAIAKLEALDIEQFDDSSRKVDIGTGMYYEKMSRRFIQIIQDHDLDTLEFIPIHNLKYHLFNDIRNLKNSDILPILNLMKDTLLIRDIIEINTTLQLIIIKKSDLEFTKPESVIITFVYDENELTVQKLLKLTQWDYIYAKKILDGLRDKGILSVTDDLIKIEAFKEKAKWNELIDNQIKKEKLKEEEKQKRQLELMKKLKTQLEDTKKEIKIEEEKPVIKEIKKDLEEEDNLEGDLVPQIKFNKKPAVKKLPPSMKKMKKEESQLESEIENLKEEQPDLIEIISQKILSYLEKFSSMNGGLTQYEKIKNFILEDYSNIKDKEIKTTLNQLKELQLIHGSIKIGKFNIYLFKDLKLNPSEKQFIKYAISKEPLKKEDFMKGLKWDEEKTLKSMKSLQEKGILRIEANNITIPGIIQKNLTKLS